MAYGTDFGGALFMLKRGNSVARAGWNGKGMWLFLVPGDGWQFVEGAELRQAVAAGDETARPYERAPWIAMKTADNKIVPWLASQTDILAVDWDVVT